MALASAHVDELDVVQGAVGDGLVHLLVLGDALPEVLQRLLRAGREIFRTTDLCVLGASAIAHVAGADMHSGDGGALQYGDLGSTYIPQDISK